MLRAPSLVAELRTMLAPDLWIDPDDRKIAEAVLGHFDSYGKCPDDMAFRTIIEDLYEDEEEADIHFARVSEGETADERFLNDRVVEFEARRRIQDAIEQSALMLQTGTPLDDIRSTLNKATVAKEHEQNSISSWSDTISDRLKIYRSRQMHGSRVQTGLSFLDRVTEDGLAAGELGVILGRPNGGKSTVLINLGKAAMLMGYKVLHYTLEMSHSSVARRYDMSITGLNKDELRTKQRTAYEYMQKVASDMKDGGLRVHQYATGQATTSILTAHLHRLQQVDHWKPDLILVDYAALMTSPRNYDNMRHELADIYRALRGIAGKDNVPIWTAHQTNRSGAQSELITMADLAECYEIAAISDVIVSFNQTPEERNANTARLFLAKNREGEASSSEHIKVDFTRCQIRDMD